jgi:hypothetical protein
MASIKYIYILAGIYTLHCTMPSSVSCASIIEPAVSFDAEQPHMLPEV